MFRGDGVRSKAVHDIPSKHQKDKKLRLHIDLTYYQGNKMYAYIALCVVQSSMQLQQKDWNKYVYFQWEHMYV